MTLEPGTDNELAHREGKPEHDGPNWMRLSAPQSPDLDEDDDPDGIAEAQEEERCARIACEAEERRKARDEAHERELAERKAKREAERVEIARISRQRQRDRKAGRKVSGAPGKTGITFGAAAKPAKSGGRKPPKSRALDGEMTTIEVREYIGSLGQYRCQAAICRAIKEKRLRATRRGRCYYTTREDVDAYLAATMAVRQERARVVGKARVEKAKAKKRAA